MDCPNEDCGLVDNQKIRKQSGKILYFWREILPEGYSDCYFSFLPTVGHYICYTCVTDSYECPDPSRMWLYVTCAPRADLIADKVKRPRDFEEIDSQPECGVKRFRDMVPHNVEEVVSHPKRPRDLSDSSAKKRFKMEEFHPNKRMLDFQDDHNNNKRPRVDRGPSRRPQPMGCMIPYEEQPDYNIWVRG